MTIVVEPANDKVINQEDFINNKYKGKVLTVDVDDIDFLNNPRDFAAIVDRIDAHLFGLFP